VRANAAASESGTASEEASSVRANAAASESGTASEEASSVRANAAASESGTASEEESAPARPTEGATEAGTEQVPTGQE
jgi:hypothetical protein